LDISTFDSFELTVPLERADSEAEEAAELSCALPEALVWAAELLPEDEEPQALRTAIAAVIRIQSALFFIF